MAPYGNQTTSTTPPPKKRSAGEKTLWEILTTKEVSPRRLKVPVKQQMIFFRQLAVAPAVPALARAPVRVRKIDALAAPAVDDVARDSIWDMLIRS